MMAQGWHDSQMTCSPCSSLHFEVEKDRHKEKHQENGTPEAGQQEIKQQKMTSHDDQARKKKRTRRSCDVPRDVPAIEGADCFQWCVIGAVALQRRWGLDPPPLPSA